MSEILDNMIKGLVLHYLCQGTVQSAFEQGQKGGLPIELLESLPGMMFEITSAAGAVFAGARTFENVIDEIIIRVSAAEDKQNVDRMDVEKLLQMSIDFMNKLATENGIDRSLPEMSLPWYKYEDVSS